MGSVVENEELIEVDVPRSCNTIELGKVFKPTLKSAFVILNQKITLTNFSHIWSSYELKVCADGGANRLYDYYSTNSERLNHIPDFIVGDLDSLRPEVGEWYKSHGTKIIRQETQYATDLMKALDLIDIYYAYNGIDNLKIDNHDGLIELHEKITDKSKNLQVLLLGALDGRFDHTIQSISILLKRAIHFPRVRLFFISNTDLVFQIPKGVNFIDYKENTELFHGSNNGLLPLGGEALLTTNGLKWDVDKWESSLITSVSSSNRFVGKSGAVVETNNPIVMNIEIDYRKI